MKKRILSLLLALVMLVGLLPTVALAAEDETTSGTCGENVTWSYNAESKTPVSYTHLTLADEL